MPARAATVARPRTDDCVRGRSLAQRPMGVARCTSITGTTSDGPIAFRDLSLPTDSGNLRRGPAPGRPTRRRGDRRRMGAAPLAPGRMLSTTRLHGSTRSPPPPALSRRWQPIRPGTITRDRRESCAACRRPNARRRERCSDGLREPAGQPRRRGRERQRGTRTRLCGAPLDRTAEARRQRARGACRDPRVDSLANDARADQPGAAAFVADARRGEFCKRPGCWLAGNAQRNGGRYGADHESIDTRASRRASEGREGRRQ